MWLPCVHVLLISYRATDCTMAKMHLSCKVGNVCNAQQILDTLTMDMVNISVCNIKNCNITYKLNMYVCSVILYKCNMLTL